MTNLTAFLDLIAFSEGTSTSKWTKNNGYDVLVSGVNDTASDHIFNSYSDHPFQRRPAKVVRYNPLLRSTAAGRYQIILPTWGDLAAKLMLHNFEPFCQDCVAIELIKEHGALDAVQGGLIEQAIFLCSKVWASFPGNDYGQSGGHTMEVLEAKFKTINPPLSQI